MQKHILDCAFTSCVQGVLLLDLEASDLPAIVNAVVDKLVTHDLLAEEDRGKLMRTLLLKHKYVFLPEVTVSCFKKKELKGRKERKTAKSPCTNLLDCMLF